MPQSDTSRVDKILSQILPPVEGWLSAIMPEWLTKALIEFLVFGIKQAWACLFGGLLLLAMIVTRYAYPESAPIARYDFLVRAVVMRAARIAACVADIGVDKVSQLPKGCALGQVLCRTHR